MSETTRFSIDSKVVSEADRHPPMEITSFDSGWKGIYEPNSSPPAELIPSSYDPQLIYESNTILGSSFFPFFPGPWVRRTPKPPIFIKPLGLHPNPFFVGRWRELETLHGMLFDKERRSKGTSAVLIQSLPGEGKSYLARQYVYTHRNCFPGGVFWLQANTEAELEAGFWDIAQKIGLHEDLSPQTAVADSLEVTTRVREWLSQRDGWLVVFDGIRFTTRLERFIPDRPNSGLIYTSTDSSAVGNQYFLSPQPILLSHFSPDDAQELLLLELNEEDMLGDALVQYVVEMLWFSPRKLLFINVTL